LCRRRRARRRRQRGSMYGSALLLLSARVSGLTSHGSSRNRP